MRDQRTKAPTGGDVDLLEWTDANREQLVIKPTHDAAAHGVVLGRETDSVGGRAAIDRALDGDHIVQRRIETPATEFPLIDGGRGELIQDTDPFVFDGELTTFCSRLGSTGVTNVSAGVSREPSVIVNSSDGHFPVAAVRDRSSTMAHG